MEKIKTNVMRILDRAKVKYNTYAYDHSDGLIDGVSGGKQNGTAGRKGI